MRRDFLRLSAATLAGSAEGAPSTGRAKNCIVLCLVGGPSQLETFDPKPDAPSEIRGPFQAIATSVPGTRLSEHLPRLASIAHRFALIRSVHHEAAPAHETGLQLLQTGRLCRPGVEHPHFGAALAKHLGASKSGAPPFIILPTPIGNTGINVSHGQNAGTLGTDFKPAMPARFARLLSPKDRDRYGKTAFGDACARSVQLVEQGTRCVVVNMFETVYDRITWDCHADRHCLSSTLDDYRRRLCPTFDHAFSALLDDLHQRGLFDETLVVAMGEFGRTPRLNANGGRDHWPGCWSIVLAGGGVRGGQVVGTSDRIGAEPANRPVACAEVTASVYNAMGLSMRVTGLVDAAPVRELVG